MSKLTHFGYQKIDEREKTEKVADVFNQVAGRYDLMNDLMSGGLHRLWKAFAVSQAGVRKGFKVLDVAGGRATWRCLFPDRSEKTARCG